MTTLSTTTTIFSLVPPDSKTSPNAAETVKTGFLADANPIRFSTKWWDEETDLGWWGYRYYHPGEGRWLSRDPIEERGGANQYAYVLNDPMNVTDGFGQSPAGRSPWTKLKCVGCNSSAENDDEGHYHWGSEKRCTTNPSRPPKWEDGSSDSLEHGCQQLRGWRGTLCNTETSLKIRYQDRECCCASHLFEFTCSYSYVGGVDAAEYARLHLVVTFLGERDVPDNGRDAQPSGPPKWKQGRHSADVSLENQTVQGVISIPCRGDVTVLSLKPVVLADGYPNEIYERMSASCSVRCVNNAIP